MGLKLEKYVCIKLKDESSSYSHFEQKISLVSNRIAVALKDASIVSDINAGRLIVLEPEKALSMLKKTFSDFKKLKEDSVKNINEALKIESEGAKKTALQQQLTGVQATYDDKLATTSAYIELLEGLLKPEEEAEEETPETDTGKTTKKGSKKKKEEETE